MNNLDRHFMSAEYKSGYEKGYAHGLRAAANKEITALLNKAKSQQRQWKRPSNQVIQEMINMLERVR